MKYSKLKSTSRTLQITGIDALTQSTLLTVWMIRRSCTNVIAIVSREENVSSVNVSPNSDRANSTLGEDLKTFHQSARAGPETRSKYRMNSWLERNTWVPIFDLFNFLDYRNMALRHSTHFQVENFSLFMALLDTPGQFSDWKLQVRNMLQSTSWFKN